MDAAAAQALSAVFTDIDGTITDGQGRIPAAVFLAMERARDAGLRLVPVTGRPAGWCDLIARTWPVDGVIGENGGLWFRRRGLAPLGHDHMDRAFAYDEATRRARMERLRALAEELLRRHPGARLASDQSYREFDVAVDFCEDVPALPRSEVDDIVRFFESHGCRVKVSSIHVNAWFGDFDKASMCRSYVRDVWDWEIPGRDGPRAVFFGDSPNDAPLFELFPVSVGVANVRRMAERMEVLPAFITERECAAGFVEGVDALLALRRGREPDR
jgi:HAD superfamily hydrolase (TIGR01484 family)